jgi:fatty acid/phospholipid biosynthesis enzyme
VTLAIKDLLKEQKGDVFVSAGNTGALLAGGLLLLGRIKGVDRPALPSFVPTSKGQTLLLDAGANTVCKPENYLQFATMGSIYFKHTFNIDKPSVGLINVGVEEIKGLLAMLLTAIGWNPFHRLKMKQIEMHLLSKCSVGEHKR